MITVIVKVTIKEEYLENYVAISKLLTRKFRGRPGCISYTFHQNLHHPREFLLYEQWESQTDLDGHYEALVALVGQPKEGELFPERLMNMYESAEPNFYKTI